MTSNRGYRKITVSWLPAKEWWCGCHTNIPFENEKQFLNHMKEIHPHWCENELPKILKEYA